MSMCVEIVKFYYIIGRETRIIVTLVTIIISLRYKLRRVCAVEMFRFCACTVPPEINNFARWNFNVISDRIKTHKIFNYQILKHK